MKVYKHYSLSIRLDTDEQFRFETPTGPILVTSIRIGGETLLLRGPAINKDGSSGLISREGYGNSNALDDVVKNRLLRELMKLATR